MKQDFFFLSPVLVVKVTNQNLDEVAEWCGGIVQETESRRVQGRMDKYVLVPTPKEAKVSWAFPGMFVTKRLVITMKGELKATWAVFRRDYFEKNYFETPEAASAATWDREHDEALQPKEEVTVNVSVGDAMKDAALAQIRKIAEKSGANITINVNDDQPFSHKEGTEHLTDAQRNIAEQIQTPGTELTVEGNKDRVTGEDATVFTPPEDLVPGTNGAPTFKHEHMSTEGCDEAGCSVERYADGVQMFSDKVFVCTEEKGAVEVTDEELEEFIRESSSITS